MHVGTFRARTVLGEAWARLKGSKRTYIYMTLVVAVITWLLTTAAEGLLPPAPLETITLEDGREVPLRSASPLLRLSVGTYGLPVISRVPQASELIVTLVRFAITALFAGAFTAFGLRRAVGLDVRFSMLADHIRHFPQFFVLQFLGAAAVTLLAVIWWPLTFPALIVGAVMFAFVGCYVVDRDANALEAISASWGLSSRNLGPTFRLLLIGAVLSLLVSAPFLAATFLFQSGLLSVVLAVVMSIVSAVVAALMVVAIACAFRQAAGVHTAGGDLPLDDAQAALSSGA